jgi:Pyruvate/2-oxoacid:ferredoxin oxidoreductase delta subunit/DNA-binding transcriptional ArsR family regulator
MAEADYEKLRELISINPMGCPPAPEIIEILKILFSEEEAKVALGLGFFPLPVREIAYRTGVTQEVAEKHLESLADKGVVFAREKDGEWGYAHVNTFHLFENPYRKGVHDETINKLTPLWKKYGKTLMQNFGSDTTTISRILPIQKKIESSAEILPHERVSEMIDNSKVIGIGHCACRELEQKCDAPREACMMFDATCTYLVDRGYGRYITKDDAKQKIKEFDKAGLVRQVNNTRDRLEFVCHCCSCCCSFLRAINEYGNPRVFTRSAFLPIRAVESCVGCGVCADGMCPTRSIEMINDIAEVNLESCIGCGICAAGCPNDAIRMERQVDIPEPPANIMEYGMRLLQEQGKLEAFIEVSTPKAE